MRRISFVLGAVLALGLTANPVDAQLKFGVQGAYIAGGFGSLSDLAADVEDRDVSGTFGAGARLGFDVPVLPIGAFGSFTYYFPSCDTADCSYWTGSLGATLGLPLPIVKPYILGGWQWKTYDIDVDTFDSSLANNPFAGLGVEVNFGLDLFLEGMWEFEGGIDNLPGTTADLSVTPFVIKGGLYF